MSFRDMVDFYKAGALCPDEIVTIASGPPGIGKTAAIRQAATELKDEGWGAGKVVTIILSQILPNEVSGITMPVAERHAMEIYDHYRLASLKDGDILFFDELLEADQLVMSACLTLIESREMMSGRKLPNILIAAATNQTVKPNQLKLSIRQRFFWCPFEADPDETREYIREHVGFDPGADIASKILTEGDEYNVLTPRSLTKMCKWIASSTDPEKVNQVARFINLGWGSTLGTELAKRWLEVNIDPKVQIMSALKSACEIYGVFILEGDANDGIRNTLHEIVSNEEEFRNSSMSDLMDILKSLPEWEDVLKDLSTIEIDVPDVTEEV